MILMNKADWDTLETRLKKHESFRHFVYDDATGQPIGPGTTVIGHPTIGYGRALDVKGIGLTEGQELLDSDLAECYADMVRTFPYALKINGIRQGILVEMLYNLGLQGLRKFVKMHKALERGDFSAAADEMLDSQWARRDVPRRARTLAHLMVAAEDTDAQLPQDPTV